VSESRTQPAVATTKGTPVGISVTVRDGTQVSYEGVVYPAGSTLDVPAEVADKWTRYGFLTTTAASP
jgi:hypothetical protein